LAFKLKCDNRLYPRTIPVLSVISCLVFAIIVIFSSPETWIMGMVILLAGWAYYKFDRKKNIPLRKEAIKKFQPGKVKGFSDSLTTGAIPQNCAS
jgi:chromate transport protein ChrA